MAKYTAPNLTSGIDDAIVGTVTAVPIFTPMFLIFIFGIVLMGGIVSQKRRTGSADIPMWATIASLSTFMIALALTLKEGLIDLNILVVVVVVTIFSGFWLFTSRTRNEI